MERGQQYIFSKPQLLQIAMDIHQHFYRDIIQTFYRPDALAN